MKGEFDIFGYALVVFVSIGAICGAVLCRVLDL